MVRGGRGGGYCYCQLQIYVYSSRIYYLLYLFSITHLHGDQGHLRSSRGEGCAGKRESESERARAREGQHGERKFRVKPYYSPGAVVRHIANGWGDKVDTASRGCYEK